MKDNNNTENKNTNQEQYKNGLEDQRNDQPTETYNKLGSNEG